MLAIFHSLLCLRCFWLVEIRGSSDKPEYGYMWRHSEQGHVDRPECSKGPKPHCLDQFIAEITLRGNGPGVGLVDYMQCCSKKGVTLRARNVMLETAVSPDASADHAVAPPQHLRLGNLQHIGNTPLTCRHLRRLGPRSMAWLSSLGILQLNYRGYKDADSDQLAQLELRTVSPDPLRF